MAWTSPMTAVSGQIFTASQYNTHIRDNLLETGVGTVTAAGQILVTTGTNSVSARTPTEHTIATSESTSGDGEQDLATVGPTVTLETGTAAIVFMTARIDNNTANAVSRIRMIVSGASSIAESAERSLARDGRPSGNPVRLGMSFLQDGLTPGSNTFTMRYICSSGTVGTFANRQIAVLPL